MMHKAKARDFAKMLHLYDKDFLDDEGESYYQLQKVKDPVFFEKIVSLLPMHVPSLDSKNLINVVEVLVRRNLGSERLFLNYIYLQIERRVLKYPVDLYCRMVRAIADK